MDKKEIFLKIKKLEEQLAIEEEPPRLEVGDRVRIENPRPGQESEGTIFEARPKLQQC